MVAEIEDPSDLARVSTSEKSFEALHDFHRFLRKKLSFCDPYCDHDEDVEDDANSHSVASTSNGTLNQVFGDIQQSLFEATAGSRTELTSSKTTCISQPYEFLDRNSSEGNREEFLGFHDDETPEVTPGVADDPSDRALSDCITTELTSATSTCISRPYESLDRDLGEASTEEFLGFHGDETTKVLLSFVSDRSDRAMSESISAELKSSRTCINQPYGSLDRNPVFQADEISKVHLVFASDSSDSAMSESMSTESTSAKTTGVSRTHRFLQGNTSEGDTEDGLGLQAGETEKATAAFTSDPLDSPLTGPILSENDDIQEFQGLTPMGADSLDMSSCSAQTFFEEFSSHFVEQSCSSSGDPGSSSSIGLSPYAFLVFAFVSMLLCTRSGRSWMMEAHMYSLHQMSECQVFWQGESATECFMESLASGTQRYTRRCHAQGFGCFLEPIYVKGRHYHSQLQDFIIHETNSLQWWGVGEWTVKQIDFLYSGCKVALPGVCPTEEHSNVGDQTIIETQTDANRNVFTVSQSVSEDTDVSDMGEAGILPVPPIALQEVTVSIRPEIGVGSSEETVNVLPYRVSLSENMERLAMCTSDSEEFQQHTEFPGYEVPTNESPLGVHILGKEQEDRTELSLSMGLENFPTSEESEGQLETVNFENEQLLPCGASDGMERFPMRTSDSEECHQYTEFPGHEAPTDESPLGVHILGKEQEDRTEMGLENFPTSEESEGQLGTVNLANERLLPYRAAEGMERFTMCASDSEECQQHTEFRDFEATTDDSHSGVHILENEQEHETELGLEMRLEDFPTSEESQGQPGLSDSDAFAQNNPPRTENQKELLGHREVEAGGRYLLTAENEEYYQVQQVSVKVQAASADSVRLTEIGEVDLHADKFDDTKNREGVLPRQCFTRRCRSRQAFLMLNQPGTKSFSEIRSESVMSPHHDKSKISPFRRRNPNAKSRGPWTKDLFFFQKWIRR